jgi:hypothetical protein
MRIRLLSGAAALSMLIGAAGLSAQTATMEKKEKTTIDIKGGKDVTLVGCIARSTGASDYVLLDDKDGSIKYALVTDDDMKKFVDHRVEVKGRAADQGDAKVTIERKTEGTSGTESKAKIEARGDSTMIPYMAAKSVKQIDGSCDF